MTRIESYVAFIKETERLKSVLRTAWTSTGRHESTAEHSWRLAMLAGLFLREFPQMDGQKVLLMCLLHDLGEIYEGDRSAATFPDEAQKYRDEYFAVTKVFSLLPGDVSAEYFSIWQEYEENKSPESRLVKALDKAETIIQHNQGKNPGEFDYDFNLEYGKKHFAGDEYLTELRALLDGDTAAHIKSELK